MDTHTHTQHQNQAEVNKIQVLKSDTQSFLTMRQYLASTETVV